jgi:hypothetical protein
MFGCHHSSTLCIGRRARIGVGIRPQARGARVHTALQQHSARGGGSLAAPPTWGCALARAFQLLQASGELRGQRLERGALVGVEHAVVGAALHHHQLNGPDPAVPPPPPPAAPPASTAEPSAAAAAAAFVASAQARTCAAGTRGSSPVANTRAPARAAASENGNPRRRRAPASAPRWCGRCKRAQMRPLARVLEQQECGGVRRCAKVLGSGEAAGV